MLHLIDIKFRSINMENFLNATLEFIRIYLHTHIASDVFFVSWMKDIKAARATAVIASPYSCCLLSCLISYMVCIRFLERDLHDIVAILNSSFHKFLGTTVKDMHSYLDYVTSTFVLTLQRHGSIVLLEPITYERHLTTKVEFNVILTRYKW